MVWGSGGIMTAFGGLLLKLIYSSVHIPVWPTVDICQHPRRPDFDRGAIIFAEIIDLMDAGL